MIPGKPDIPGLPDYVTDSLIGFGGAFAINMIFGNVWGVFTQFGIPVLLVDTVYSVKYQNTSMVSQAPIERGTFASYNKVQDPYQATVALVKGGGDATARGAFLAQIEALSRSTLLFNIVTPEFVHANASIVGYDYAREPNSGARMIVANVHLQEIRETTVLTETVETENPEDSPILQNGEVQPQSVPDSILLRAVEYGRSLF